MHMGPIPDLLIFSISTMLMLLFVCEVAEKMRYFVPQRSRTMF